MKANFGQCYHSRGSCSFFVSPIVDSIRDFLKNIRKWLLTNVPVKKKSAVSSIWMFKPK